jgi:hypothetical protein
VLARLDEMRTMPPELVRFNIRALAAQPFLIDTFRLAAQYPPRERRFPHPLRLFLVIVGRPL